MGTTTTICTLGIDPNFVARWFCPQFDGGWTRWYCNACTIDHVGFSTAIASSNNKTEKQSFYQIWQFRDSKHVGKEKTDE